ncbi:hypothetical protein [Peribacillus frigoritolerans]|uniref:hypothetical protein n=1 Tax=Peribacillus frigoritolerans TaxID=450367 RepID=UPI0039A3D046
MEEESPIILQLTIQFNSSYNIQYTKDQKGGYGEGMVKVSQSPICLQVYEKKPIGEKIVPEKH